MRKFDRRSVLKLVAAGAAGSVFKDSIAKAMALPANNQTRSIKDVEHIVILMQENRSFDHYFGTLSGIRGFADPRAVQLPNGRSVFLQQNGSGILAPFRPALDNLGLQFITDTPHDWNTAQATWNGGHWDQWVAQKTTATMVHFERGDIPFHYALADAFTICDAYHCSVLGPTYPNRNYMFTGWTGNDGSGNGPQLDTSALICDWPTYPERLLQAGISWKVYQDIGSGLTAANNWGDDPDHYIGNSANNTLLRFTNYQQAADGSPLALLARTGTDINASGTLFDELTADIANGTLPQVSWLMCPNAYDEHPNWPANYGAWFISQVMDVLTANPEVWARTAMFLTYDENDGFFDHVVPPTAPASASDGSSTVSVANEYFAGNATHSPGPFGMGPRVPMVVISPWSRGGWVNSQVFDHSSLVRFIETRFADEHPDLIEPQITPWRRAVSGDLTSAFDFATPNQTLPALPSTASYLPPDRSSHDNTPFTLPDAPSIPAQEPGFRRARALPYALDVSARPDAAAGAVVLTFRNSGAAAVVIQVRDNTGIAAPRRYTVEAGKQVSDQWTTGTGSYDLAAYGPNGFFRGFGGSLAAGAALVGVSTDADPLGTVLLLSLNSAGVAPLHLDIADAYSQRTQRVLAVPGVAVPVTKPVQQSYGWYDLVLTSPEHPELRIAVAGHLENGGDSITDPAIGWTGTT